MDLEFNIELIQYAFEKNAENTIWEMWLARFVNMNKESIITFEEFKSKLLPQKVSQMSYEEIENEFEKVVKAYERR